MTVDPHLLPSRPAQPQEGDSAPADSAPADADAPRGGFAVGADGETSPSDAPVEAADPVAAETPVEADAPAEHGFDAPATGAPGDSRLSEAVARSRSIPVDDEPEQPKTLAEELVETEPVTDDTAATPNANDDLNSQPLAMPNAAVNDTTAEPDIYADVTPETEPAPAATQEPDPVTPAAESSPTEGLLMEPDKRGNRGFAFFTALLATIVFAALYTVLFAGIRLVFNPEADLVGGMTEFIGTAPFYVPVALFLVLIVVWSLIANRAGWWSYILASLIAAGVAGAAYYVGVAFQDVVNGQPWSNEALTAALRTPEHLPGALIAFIAANQSALWIGGIAALRGRRVKRKNAEERAEYERKVAEEREYEAQRTTIGLDETR
jgi:hypothetical protein